MFSQGKRVDAPLVFPLGQATPKIGFNARRSLVAVLSVLGQQLHDDGRDRSGNVSPFVGWHWLPGNVAVHPLQRIGSGERELTGEHLVKRDAEGVKISSGIDRAIHSPGLLGRHVCESAGYDLGSCRRLTFAGKPRGETKAHQPTTAKDRGDHNIRWSNILVDNTGEMQLADRA